MSMDEREAKILLSDLYAGLGRVEGSVHDQHRFLERIPLDEDELKIAYIKGEVDHLNHEYRR